MNSKRYSLFLFLFTLLNINLYAQSGQSDVQLILSDLICPGNILFDIEVRASSPDTEFFVSEQNYRFSYDTDVLANPYVSQEFTLSGFIAGTPGPNGFAFFAAHNLLGSVDSVITYNVELSGGDGYYIIADEWTKVGQIGFEFLQDSACVDLTWHTSEVFPDTFVGEVYTTGGGAAPTRTRTEENMYGDYSECLTCLPVELVYFEGEERDCKIHLSWETATEVNSSHFIIQHSSDATNFHEIGRLEAAGNSLQPMRYDFMDISAGQETYYRLKQVDADGSFKYTKVIKINSTCFEEGDDNTIVDIFPNPVRDADVYIKMYANTEYTANVTVMDMTGRVVLTEPQSIIEGRNLLTFSTENLPTGAYFVRIEGNDWRTSAHKFIKIK